MEPVGAVLSRVTEAEMLVVTHPAASRASSHTVFAPSLAGAARVQVLVAVYGSQATPVMSSALATRMAATRLATPLAAMARLTTPRRVHAPPPMLSEATGAAVSRSTVSVAEPTRPAESRKHAVIV